MRSISKPSSSTTSIPLTRSQLDHLHAQSAGEILCDRLFLWVFLTHSKMDDLHAQSTGEILCVLLFFYMDFSH